VLRNVSRARGLGVPCVAVDVGVCGVSAMHMRHHRIQQDTGVLFGTQRAVFGPYLQPHIGSLFQWCPIRGTCRHPSG
jgi:hypothetical protein